MYKQEAERTQERSVSEIGNVSRGASGYGESELCADQVDYSQVIVVTNRKLCRVPDDRGGQMETESGAKDKSRICTESGDSSLARMDAKQGSLSRAETQMQDALCRQLEKVCALRPSAVILREKDLEESVYAVLGKRVSEICRRYGVQCIYHSFPAAAQAAGEKRMHLPLWKMEDLTEEERRAFEQIGVSVHSVEEAVRAEKLGASYLTAGHIFTTDCKKDLPPRGLAFLKEVCDAVSIPVWAIGGIDLNPVKMMQVRQAGAAGGCVMSAMMKM